MAAENDDLRDQLAMRCRFKQEPCDDVVSRQAVLDELNKWEWQELYLPIHFKENIIDVVPSVRPQEPCADAVSRKAVIDAMYDLFDVKNDRMVLIPWSASAIDVRINALPSVQPKQTGHWIEHPEIETSEPEYLMFYECSECGDEQCFCKSDVHKKRFCSNCGAKMGEPQESEDKE